MFIKSFFLTTAFVFCVFVSLWVNVARAEEGGSAVDPNKQYRDNKSLQLLCQQTVAHIPWDDVKYKGGMDQKGNFVVAADTGMAFSPYEYPIDIPIQLDVLEKINLNVPIGIIADADIAGIKIYEDGTVKYNGQDVTPQIGVFCKEKMLDPALLEKAKEAEAEDETHQAEGVIKKEELGAPIAGEAH